MDLAKQVDYWQRSALDDWEAAVALTEKAKYRHGLFLAHLALEKMLKAHVCKRTGDLPPRTHTLTKLADRAGLVVSARRRSFLDQFDMYQMEGRYPDPDAGPIRKTEAAGAMKKAEAVLAWLQKTL